MQATGYDQGYEPEFEGKAAFKGEWVHPQFWPGSLDHADKKVVVIGSGTTAMTLVPNMSRHATSRCCNVRRPMLSQAFHRWPCQLVASRFTAQTGLWPRPMAQHGLATVDVQSVAYRPGGAQALAAEKSSGRNRWLVDVEKHFTPRYNPGSASVSGAG